MIGSSSRSSARASAALCKLCARSPELTISHRSLRSIQSSSHRWPAKDYAFANSNAPRRAFSTSLRRSAKSSIADTVEEEDIAARAAQVETLPFLVSTSQATSLLRSAAVKAVFREDPQPFINRLIYSSLRSIPFRFMQEWFEEGAVKMEKTTAFFLPIWIVDAIVKAQAKGSEGTAEMTLVFEHSRVPGHAWKDMDTLPLTAINEDFMHALHESDERYRSDPNFQSHYEIFSEEKHMKPKNVSIKSGKIVRLPFVVSPLHFPELLQKASKNLLSMNVTLPKLAQGVTQVTIPLPFTNKYAMMVPFPKDLNEIDSGDDRDAVRFVPDTIRVDMYATYPVYIPVHMAEWSWIDQQGKRKSLLTAMNGHDLTGHQICRSNLDRKWSISSIHGGAAQLKFVDFFPRPPFESPLTRAEREREEKAKQASNAEEQVKRVEEDLKDSVARRTIETAGALGFTGFNLMLKASKLLQNVDWNPLRRLERESWQDRVKARASKAGKNESPTMAKGGDNIFWSSPQVQRYSKNSWGNRKYMMAYLDYLLARRAMTSMEDATDEGSQKFMIVTKNGDQGAKDYESVKAYIVKALEKRNRLMPEWLQKLKEGRDK